MGSGKREVRGGSWPLRGGTRPGCSRSAWASLFPLLINSSALRHIHVPALQRAARLPWTLRQASEERYQPGTEQSASGPTARVSMAGCLSFSALFLPNFFCERWGWFCPAAQMGSEDKGDLNRVRGEGGIAPSSVLSSWAPSPQGHLLCAAAPEGGSLVSRCPP